MLARFDFGCAHEINGVRGYAGGFGVKRPNLVLFRVERFALAAREVRNLPEQERLEEARRQYRRHDSTGFSISRRRRRSLMSWNPAASSSPRIDSASAKPAPTSAVATASWCRIK